MKFAFLAFPVLFSAALAAPAANFFYGDGNILKVAFDSPQLVNLVDHWRSSSEAGDQLTIEAIQNKDAFLLRETVRCPICSQIPHSESLVTTSCGHVAHDECLKLNDNFCPTCGNGGPHNDLKRQTFIKAALELFERRRWLPPKPTLGRYGLYNTRHKETPVGFMVKRLDAHVRMIELVIREIANAFNDTKDSLADPRGMWALWDAVGNYDQNNAVPLPIRGVTMHVEPDDTIASMVQYFRRLFIYDYPGLDSFVQDLSSAIPAALAERYNVSSRTYRRTPTPQQDAAGAEEMAQARSLFLSELSRVRWLAQRVLPAEYEIPEVPTLAQLYNRRNPFRCLIRACGLLKPHDDARRIEAKMLNLVVGWLKSLSTSVGKGLYLSLPFVTPDRSFSQNDWSEKLQDVNEMMSRLLRITIQIESKGIRAYKLHYTFLQMLLRRPEVLDQSAKTLYPATTGQMLLLEGEILSV